MARGAGRFAPTVRRDQAGNWFLLAGAAFSVLALGLVWHVDVSFSPGYYVGGYYIPSTEYGVGGWAPAFHVGGGPQTQTITGTQLPIRVFLAVAWMLVLVGRRRGQRALLLAGPAVLTVGIVVSRIGSGAGAPAAIAAVACMILALRADGMWQFDRRILQRRGKGAEQPPAAPVNGAIF